MGNTRQKPITETPVDDQLAVTDGRLPGWYWIDNAINTAYAPRVKASGIAVYTALVLLSRGRPEFHAGLTTIATLAGLDSRETVISALQRLEDCRLIAVFRKDGRASSYRILNVGGPDPNVSRPQRPKDRPQPVGLTDSSAPNQSVKPTTQPVGKTDRLAPNQSEIPTGQPVGKTDRLAPNQSEIPTGLSTTSRNFRTDQSEIPTLHRLDTHHHSNTPIHNDDDDALPRTRRAQFATWDELREHYGDDEVVMAQRVASNQSRRNDLAYIAGVCFRRAAQGSPRPPRPEPNPAALLPRPEPEYAVAPPPSLPPPSPEWQRVINFDRRVTAWTRMRGELIGAELVLTSYASIASDVQERLGQSILHYWKLAGNPPVEAVRFVTAGGNQ